MVQDAKYLARRKSTRPTMDEGSSWTMDLRYGGTLFADVDRTFRVVREEQEDRRRSWMGRAPPLLA